MAFTKVAPAGIGTEPGDGYRIGNSFLHATGLNVSGIVTATQGGTVTYYGDGSNLTGIDATAIKHTNGDVKAQATATGVNITGNLGVSGVLTYEDVTNIDSVGVITARSGIKIGPTAGVAGTFFADGSYVTAGIITAASFVGDGSGLTGAGPSLANGANNRIITATGANALTGESNFTYDGNTATITASSGYALVANGSSNGIGLGSNGAIVFGNPNIASFALGILDASQFQFKISGSEKLSIGTNGKLSVTGTGAMKIPAGTTGERPGSSVAGDIRYNSSNSTLEFFTGSAWVGTNVAPSLNSVTGDIYNGMAGRTLVISCNDISASGNDVKYSNNSTGAVIATDTSATTSGSNVTSTIPAGVYNTAAGTVIKIEVLNGAGVISSNSLTKTILASPSGGTITSAGGYRYHTFTSSGTFTNTIASLSVQYLVVAGGGGGGGNQGGGAGGAGGYRTGSATLGTGTFSASIGGGGANGGNGNGGHGNDGGNSSFNSLTSTGGGGGVNMRTGGYHGQNGRSGGSGGGASHWMNGNFSGGSGTSGQGNGGGDALDTESLGHNGGGGGGAGAGGSDGRDAYGGNGGNGSTWLNGTTYAGGGGGGCYYQNNSGGASNYSIGGGAGTGGGGRGSRNTGSKLSTNYSAPTTNQNGVDGYGGGGGGGGDNPGDGGDGVVIIRYQ